MKNSLPALGLGILVSLLSCKKEGSSPTNPVGDQDYIEFKLDDTLKRIVGGMPLSSAAMVLARTPTNYLTMIYSDGTDRRAGADDFWQVSLSQYSNQPIAKRTYTYSALNAQEFPTFSFTITPQPFNSFLTDLNHSKGSLTITRLDSSSGGKIEGTFAYDSLYFQKPGNVRIPGWHRVTEGKFRITRS